MPLAEPLLRPYSRTHGATEQVWLTDRSPSFVPGAIGSSTRLRGGRPWHTRSARPVWRGRSHNKAAAQRQVPIVSACLPTISATSSGT